MTCQLAKSDTSNVYPIEYPLAPSSVITDNPPTLRPNICERDTILGPQHSFEIELSSTIASFETKIETFSARTHHANNIVMEGILEYDVTVHMPPKKKYDLKLKIIDKRMAEPKIVEPDWI